LFLHAQAFALKLDDAALTLGLRGYIFGSRQIGDIHGVRRHVLQIAAASVRVEFGALDAEYLEDSLIDTVLGEESMHIDAAHLAHAMSAGDRLLLDRRVPLGFGDDDNRRGLNVEADAAGLDLGDEDRGRETRGELIDQGLPLLLSAAPKGSVIRSTPELGRARSLATSAAAYCRTPEQAAGWSR